MCFLYFIYKNICVLTRLFLIIYFLTTFSIFHSKTILEEDNRSAKNDIKYPPVCRNKSLCAQRILFLLKMKIFYFIFIPAKEFSTACVLFCAASLKAHLPNATVLFVNSLR